MNLFFTHYCEGRTHRRAPFVQAGRRTAGQRLRHRRTRKLLTLAASRTTRRCLRVDASPKSACERSLSWPHGSAPNNSHTPSCFFFPVPSSTYPPRRPRSPNHSRYSGNGRLAPPQNPPPWLRFFKIAKTPTRSTHLSPPRTPPAPSRTPPWLRFCKNQNLTTAQHTSSTPLARLRMRLTRPKH